MATMTTTEKEKALKDLHEIPDTLQSIGRATDTLARINVNLDRIADALETIAAEMVRGQAEPEHERRARLAAIQERAFNTISSGRGRGE